MVQAIQYKFTYCVQKHNENAGGKYIYSLVYDGEVAVSGDHTRYSFGRLGLALLDGGGEWLQVKEKFLSEE
jgi:hypothetical protein